MNIESLAIKVPFSEIEIKSLTLGQALLFVLATCKTQIPQRLQPQYDQSKCTNYWFRQPRFVWHTVNT